MSGFSFGSSTSKMTETSVQPVGVRNFGFGSSTSQMTDQPSLPIGFFGPELGRKNGNVLAEHQKEKELIDSLSKEPIERIFQSSPTSNNNNSDEPTSTQSSCDNELVTLTRNIILKRTHELVCADRTNKLAKYNAIYLYYSCKLIPKSEIIPDPIMYLNTRIKLLFNPDFDPCTMDIIKFWDLVSSKPGFWNDMALFYHKEMMDNFISNEKESSSLIQHYMAKITNLEEENIKLHQGKKELEVEIDDLKIGVNELTDEIVDLKEQVQKKKKRHYYSDSDTLEDSSLHSPGPASYNTPPNSPHYIPTSPSYCPNWNSLNLKREIKKENSKWN